MSRAVLVVPCFNEERRLPVPDFESFLRTTPDVDFVLVDDGSTDGTLECLRALEREAPERIRVHALPRNVGKAEAVRAGLCLALEDRPAFVGFWDADLATPLSASLDFLRQLEEAPELEMIFAARVVLLGRRIERRILRHYLGRLAATAISVVLNLRVYDTQCGAKLFRATPTVAGLFQDPFVARWLFDVEIIARRIQAAGGDSREVAKRIYEYPLTRWVDVGGSKLGALDYLRAARDLIRIRRRYRAPAGAPRPPG